MLLLNSTGLARDNKGAMDLNSSKPQILKLDATGVLVPGISSDKPHLELLLPDESHGAGSKG